MPEEPISTAMDLLREQEIMHTMHIRPVRTANFAYRNPFADPIPQSYGGGIGTARRVNNNPTTVNLKERHPNQDERRVLNKPRSDWKLVNGKEVCVSAATIEVSDLLDKHGIKVKKLPRIRAERPPVKVPF
jgi:hypothetical protein